MPDDSKASVSRPWSFYRGTDLVEFAIGAIVDRNWANSRAAAARLREERKSSSSKGSDDHWYLRQVEGVRNAEPRGRDFCAAVDNALYAGREQGRERGDREQGPRHVASFFDSMTDALAIGSMLEPKWLAELVEAGPARTIPEVLLRGRALAALFREVGDRWGELESRPIEPRRRTGPAGEPPPSTYAVAVGEVIEGLLVLMALPPGKGGYEANRVLATVAPASLPMIEKELDRHPLAWRLARTITLVFQSVYPSQGTATALNSPERTPWGDETPTVVSDALDILRAIMRREPRNIYRARSLSIEACRFAPRQDTEWIDEQLESRATEPQLDDTPPPGEDGRLSTRERQYAAYVLWLRWTGHDPAQLRRYDPAQLRRSEHGDGTADEPELSLDVRSAPYLRLRPVIEQMKDDEDPGVRWAATTLALLAAGLDPTDPEVAARAAHPGRNRGLQALRRAYLDQLDPVTLVHSVVESREGRKILNEARLRPKTERMFTAMVVAAATMCDGTTRRNILDAFTTAGLHHEAARMFVQIATTIREQHDRPEMRFLIEQCVFCASYTGASLRALPYLCREAGLTITDPSPELPRVSPRSDSDPSSPEFDHNAAIRIAALVGIGELATDLERFPRTADHLALAMVQRLEDLAGQRNLTGSERVQLGDGRPVPFLTHIGPEVRALTYSLTMLRDKSALDMLRLLAAPSGGLGLKDFTAAQIAQWGLERTEMRDTAAPDWVRLVHPGVAADEVTNRWMHGATGPTRVT